MVSLSKRINARTPKYKPERIGRALKALSVHDLIGRENKKKLVNLEKRSLPKILGAREEFVKYSGMLFLMIMISFVSCISKRLLSSAKITSTKFFIGDSSRCFYLGFDKSSEMGRYWFRESVSKRRYGQRYLFFASNQWE